jgi:hypothetical protein
MLRWQQLSTADIIPMVRLVKKILVLLIISCLPIAFSRQIILQRSLQAQTEVTPVYELLPIFKASELLQPDELSGPHYQVVEEVTNDGYLNIFNINSDFGIFNAHGYTMLRIRLQEIAALAALEEVSKSAEFGKAMARSAVKPIKGAISVSRKPIATIKGVPSGIKRLFGNISQEVKDGLEDSSNDSERSNKSENPGEDRTRLAKMGDSAKIFAKNFFGVSASARRWAEKVKVDPYSSNEVLNNKLEEFGWVDAAGDIAKSVVVPSIPRIGIAADVNDLVWGNDPQALLKLNETRLFKMGVGSVLRAVFLENRAYTPTLQTQLVSSLFALENVDDRESFIQMAVLAENESEARFYQQSAELLAAFHNEQHKFNFLIPDLKVAAGKTSEGDIIVLLPVDYLVLTAEFKKITSAIDRQSKQHLKADNIQLWLCGKVSPKTRAQLSQLGWQITEHWHNQLH